jgi:hypothetical protein
MRLDLLLEGILIGIVVAVPVGPLGLLCVSRALMMGPLCGMLSGFGVATADSLAAGVAALAPARLSSRIQWHRPLNHGTDVYCIHVELDGQPVRPVIAGFIQDNMTAGYEKQAIVALEKLLPGYWEEQRRPLSPSDRALTGKAIDWLMTLPAKARPKTLSEQYPRIANHLALHWGDLACTQLGLMRLLADERGGRKGFSLQIEQEIGRLGAHVQSLLENAPTEPAAL